MKNHELIKEFLGELTYRVSGVPGVFFQDEGSPASVGYNLDVTVRGGEKGFYIIDLPVWLRALPKTGDNPVFTIEVVYSGLFRVENTESEDELSKILYVEAPMTLFFSVRALVEQITMNSGFSPYRLDMDRFYQLFLQKYQGESENGFENFFDDNNNNDGSDGIVVAESEKESYDDGMSLDFNVLIKLIKEEFSKESIEDYERVSGKIPGCLEEMVFFKNYLRFFKPIKVALNPENDGFNCDLLLQMLAGTSLYEYKFCMGSDGLPELNYKKIAEPEWNKVSELSQSELKKLIVYLIINYMLESMELYHDVKINSDLAESMNNEKIPTQSEFFSIYGIDRANLTIEDFFGIDRAMIDNLYNKIKEYDIKSYQFRNNDIEKIFN